MSDEVEAARDLARTLVERGASADDVRAAGVLDTDLPGAARAEVAIELGRGGLANALDLLAPASDLDTAAALCGAAETLIRVGIEYAQQREAFGRPLAAFQVQRHNFARAAAHNAAATALVRRVATADEPDPVDAAALLPAASDSAWLAAETALQIHGGYGYTDEYPVSTMWREVAAVRARTRHPAEASLPAG